MQTAQEKPTRGKPVERVFFYFSFLNEILQQINQVKFNLSQPVGCLENSAEAATSSVHSLEIHASSLQYTGCLSQPVRP